MAEAITETRLILSEAEAAAYVKYLMGFAGNITGGTNVYLGLGNISIASETVNANDPNCDGKRAVFTEIPIDAATTEDEKTTNYARVFVKSGGSYPDVLKVDPNDSRRIYNHEQIVFNKVKTTAYTANAIGLFRAETGGEAYAFGLLESKLTAAVGSLPMFEREKLALVIPDGGNLVIT